MDVYEFVKLNFTDLTRNILEDQVVNKVDQNEVDLTERLKALQGPGTVTARRSESTAEEEE